MRQRVVYFVMIWVAVTSVSAQEAKKWTLDDCIDYALEKNIQLQQDKISLEESSVDVKTAKAALFPSLSFSTGQNVTNRPYQETSNTVSGTVFEFNQNLGAFVAVDNRYSALIPMKEIHSRINVGETVEARVANVREDGKLNLSLQKPIREQINNDSEMVYNIIESYGGTLPFNDKADKEVIEKEFGLSKNAFKRAVGHLLKEGKIRITEKNIIIK